MVDEVVIVCWKSNAYFLWVISVEREMQNLCYKCPTSKVSKFYCFGHDVLHF